MSKKNFSILFANFALFFLIKLVIVRLCLGKVYHKKISMNNIRVSDQQSKSEMAWWKLAKIYCSFLIIKMSHSS